MSIDSLEPRDKRDRPFHFDFPQVTKLGSRVAALALLLSSVGPLASSAGADGNDRRNDRGNDVKKTLSLAKIAVDKRESVNGVAAVDIPKLEINREKAFIGEALGAPVAALLVPEVISSLIKNAGPTWRGVNDVDPACMGGVQRIDFTGNAMSRDIIRTYDDFVTTEGSYVSELMGSEPSGREYILRFSATNSPRIPGTPYFIHEETVVGPVDQFDLPTNRFSIGRNLKFMSGSDVVLTEDFRHWCGTVSREYLFEPRNLLLKSR